MPGLYDQAVVNQVQQANDIVDVIAEHVSLKKKGREMVGLCPFHQDHSPSMNVSPVKQIFKCFACGAGGDVFKFVQMRENLTFPQAIERLAERAGIALQPIRRARPARTADGAEQIDPNRLAKVNAWAAEYFANNLIDDAKGKSAREYLVQRGISGQSIETWRLGLALPGPNGLMKAARARNAPLEPLKQAGLVTGINQDKFINRLMFTITDVTGRVLGFGGRTLDDTGAKYVNSPTTVLFDKSNCLYGLEQARHSIVSSETAVVVEGYTDVIMAHQTGCANVVATLGTSLTSGHGRLLRRYARRVILVFDNDTAGIEAANRALEVCLAQRIDIGLATVPEGKDPCDFLLASGREAFEQVLEQAVDVFEFKWRRLQQAFDTDNTMAGRKAAIDEFLQTVATGLWAGKLTPIETGLIVNKIARIVGLDSREIGRELTKRAQRVQNAAKAEEGQHMEGRVDLGKGLYASAQRELLEVLLTDSGSYGRIRDAVRLDDFSVPALREIAEAVYAAYEADGEATLTTILARIESERISNVAVALQGVGEKKGNFKARVDDALMVMARYTGKFPAIRIGDAPNRNSGQNGKENPHSIGIV